MPGGYRASPPGRPAVLRWPLAACRVACGTDGLPPPLAVPAALGRPGTGATPHPRSERVPSPPSKWGPIHSRRTGRRRPAEGVEAGENWRVARVDTVAGAGLQWSSRGLNGPSLDRPTASSKKGGAHSRGPACGQDGPACRAGVKWRSDSKQSAPGSPSHASDQTGGSGGFGGEQFSRRGH